MMPNEFPENLKWLQIRHLASERRVAEAGLRLRENGVDFLLIKGLAASRYYPEPWKRFFSDIDICVSREDFENRTQIQETLQGLGVDLHCELRNLDELPWSVVLERAEPFEVSGVEIKAPCREDHFRILTTHWLNDGGRRVDKLEDLYQCVTTADSFDWNLCLADLTKVRRDWVAKGIGAAELFLDKNFPRHPFSKSDIQLPNWFVTTVKKESSRADIKPIAFAASLLGFLRELKSKLPPNPIQATIETNRKFQQHPPRIAQLQSLLGRTKYFFRFFVLRNR
jgi:hypothetical protein